MPEIMQAQTPIGRRLDAEMSTQLGRLGGSEPLMHFDRQGQPCTFGRSVELFEGTDGSNPWVGYDIGRGYIVSSCYEGMRGFGFDRSLPHTFRHVVFTIGRPVSEIAVDYSPNETIAARVHAELAKKYIGDSKWIRRRQHQSMQNRDRHLHDDMRFARRVWRWPSKPPWKVAR